MQKRDKLKWMIGGLFVIASFSCSSNREVIISEKHVSGSEATHHLDSVKVKSPIERSKIDGKESIKQLEISTLSNLDSVLLDDEAAGRMLQLARKDYSRALEFQKLGNQDSSEIEFEKAINDLNVLSYYPGIESDTDFVSLSRRIIGDYQKYISTVQNLTPGTSVFALQEKLSEIVDSINVTGKEFPKEEIPKTTIPLEMNKYVEQNIEFFTTRGRWHMQNWIYRSGLYMPMMKKIFKEHGLPPELAYLSMPESGLDPTARSWARAVGLWQFTRGTGNLYGLRTNWWYDERRDPVKSTEAAASYLRDLYDRYGDWYLVLASYDCGSVNRAIRRSHGRTNFWEIKRHLPREARNYVPQYIAVTLIAMNPKEYGFDDSVAPTPAPCDTVMIPESIDLKVLAEATGFSLDSLLELNPELVHAVTPPNFSGKGYPLKVPAGMGRLFAQSYDSLPESAKLTWTFHTVRYGESLYSISKRYHVSLASLKLANDLSRRTRRVRAGTTLMIPVKSSYYAYRNGNKRTSVAVSKERSIGGDLFTVHVVKHGETLSSIAQDYGTTVAELKKINHLTRSTIRPRMRLYVAASYAGNGTSDKNDPDSHKSDNADTQLDYQSSKTASADAPHPQAKRTEPTSVFYHVVTWDETLSQIATHYRVKISDLKKWNHLKSNRIRVGQRLRVFPTYVADQRMDRSADALDPESKTVYRVRRGDTLWSIARKFGVPMSKLKEWNYKVDEDIRPGQRITIYN
jgi:membrane-bound lytic murein transglycosylase D